MNSTVPEDVKRLAADFAVDYCHNNSMTYGVKEAIEAAIMADREARSDVPAPVVAEPGQRMFCTSCGSGILKGQCDCTRMQRPTPARPFSETFSAETAVIEKFFPEHADATALRPQRVQAAFEVFEGKSDTGPNATAIFIYIRQLEAELAAANADCKRANEMINTAIDDYNSELAKARQLEADKRELVEGLRNMLPGKTPVGAGDGGTYIVTPPSKTATNAATALIEKHGGGNG